MRREAAATKEFLATPGVHMHVMRDHNGHTTEIMAGMWGTKFPPEDPNSAKVKDDLTKAFAKMLKVKKITYRGCVATKTHLCRETN